MRAALLAGALALLGTGAHLLGGGSAPSTAIVLVVTLLTLPLFWWMGARPLSRLGTTTALALGQGAWHAALALSSPSSPATTHGLASPHVFSAHEACGRLTAGLATPVHIAGHPAMTIGSTSMPIDHGGWTMLLAHAVGALLFAIVLATIDAALIWLLEALSAPGLCTLELPRWLIDARIPLFVQLSPMPMAPLRGVRTVRGPPALVAVTA